MKYMFFFWVFLDTVSTLMLGFTSGEAASRRKRGSCRDQKTIKFASFPYPSLYGPVNLHDIYFRFHVEFQQYEETRRLLICLFARILVNPVVSSKRKGNEIARNRVETRFSNSFFRFRASGLPGFQASRLLSVQALFAVSRFRERRVFVNMVNMADSRRHISKLNNSTQELP